MRKLRMMECLIKLTRSFKVGLLCGASFFSIITPVYAADLKPGEWYVRLIAEVSSEQLKDQGNVLGVLRSSVDGYDKHDLKELPPFGSPSLTIIFPHADWGEHDGNYASDFHQHKHWRLGHEWEFVVMSDTPREVTLSWEGSHGLKRLWRMRLMDMETGEVIRAKKSRTLQTYTFNMVDTSHRFKWVYLARPKP